ncbi:MAG: ACT domain-containing protein [bacterium]|nr:ACT domain-containing protein [bacterium]
MEKLSELVWLYVKGRPSLREGLKYGIINHSALARIILSELDLPEERFDAVKVALIRTSKKLAEKEIGGEEKILDVLRGSSVSIQTKVAAVVSRKELDVKAITHARSGDYTTYIIEESELGKVRKERGIKLLTENLNLVTIKSKEEIEDTPGVIAFVLNALAHEGINVVEFISCYTDTILAIRERDTSRTYELLSSILK